MVAFGLGSYVTALNYPEEQRYQPYRYTEEQPPKVEAAATAQTNAQSLQYRTPCHQPEGQGESDLCAQWRAANAAKDGAFWTKWGVWIGIIGSSLLLWQIILTRQAVEDTSEATEAMRESNRITAHRNELELRPYLGLDGENATIELDPSMDEVTEEHTFLGFKIKIVVRNFGSTPAKKVIWKYTILIIKDGVHVPFVDQFEETIGCLDILPNDTHTGITPYQLEDKLVDIVRSGDTNVHLFFQMTYEGLDGAHHLLRFRLCCNDHGLRQGIWGALSDGFVST